MTCKWQVEIDDYCRRVLAKHWPDVRRHDDVRTFPPRSYEFSYSWRGCPAGPFAPDVKTETTVREWAVDVICGGFPCQDISAANHRGEGVNGERSGLWFEYARIIRELRPRYVVAENVAAITFRGLDTVLGCLAACGYDAEWQTFSAQMLGAPHERKRVFIVAYPVGERLQTDGFFDRRPSQAASEKQKSRGRSWPGQRQPSPALPNRIRWRPHGELCRVANGIPDQLDRYRVVGNSVVPQVAEWIGRRIVEFHAKAVREVIQ